MKSNHENNEKTMSDLATETAEHISKLLKQKKLEEDAVALFNAPGKTVLDFLVESAGKVGYVPISCERCGKRFRPWRKMNTVYNKTERFKYICKECIKLDDLM